MLVKLNREQIEMDWEKRVGLHRSIKGLVDYASGFRDALLVDLENAINVQPDSEESKLFGQANAQRYSLIIGIQYFINGLYVQLSRQQWCSDVPASLQVLKDDPESRNDRLKISIGIDLRSEVPLLDPATDVVLTTLERLRETPIPEKLKAVKSPEAWSAEEKRRQMVNKIMRTLESDQLCKWLQSQQLFLSGQQLELVATVQADISMSRINMIGGLTETSRQFKQFKDSPFLDRLKTALNYALFNLLLPEEEGLLFRTEISSDRHNPSHTTCLCYMGGLRASSSRPK